MAKEKMGKARAKRRSQAPSAGNQDFSALVDAIRHVHEHFASQASRAVNTNLTVRNWLIGAYIHHYELNGRDRAEYGDGLFSKLAERLGALGVLNCNRSRLYRYRDFCTTYPQIVATLSPQFRALSALEGIGGKTKKVAALTPLSGQEIVENLSYSHIELLLEIEDSLDPK